MQSTMSRMFSVKELVESGTLKSLPSRYVFQANLDEADTVTSEEATVIPTVDFALLMSGNPDQRSKVVRDIEKACREWGFFMIINHGVPRKLVEEMMRMSRSFFDLTEEEKKEYASNNLLEPIKYGTSFNLQVDNTLFWRDHLKIRFLPHFTAPAKPAGFRDVTEEYCKCMRELSDQLLKGISESLGLASNFIHTRMGLDQGFHQLLVANCYPRCPEPEIAMGLPPHSDHDIITLLTQNGVNGLQILHDGKWIQIDPKPDSILVNTGDLLEILTNGKYKSVLHRAVVNNTRTRISVGTAHGPSLDAIVSPAKELVDSESGPAYRGIAYADYIQFQQSRQLDGKSCLDFVRI